MHRGSAHAPMYTAGSMLAWRSPGGHHKVRLGGGTSRFSTCRSEGQRRSSGQGGAWNQDSRLFRSHVTTTLLLLLLLLRRRPDSRPPQLSARLRLTPADLPSLFSNLDSCTVVLALRGDGQVLGVSRGGETEGFSQQSDQDGGVGAAPMGVAVGGATHAASRSASSPAAAIFL